MIKSMTGFSKAEANEKGTTVTVEIKSLNGRYLEMNCRMPKSLSNKEFDMRNLIKKTLNRGSVNCFINVVNEKETADFKLNFVAAKNCFNSLKLLKSKLKIKEIVTMEHLLHFSDSFDAIDENDNSVIEWKLAKIALIKALKSIDLMKRKEGQNIAVDMNARMEKISDTLEKVDALGIEKIPAERERLRMRVAKLFESDEIDEHRLQTELVLLADKLDISEECVRMRSHIKFFFQTLKSRKKDPVGKKINFLLQEMNREINTIGSKCNDADISHIVVGLKEELERIREQIQNIE